MSESKLPPPMSDDELRDFIDAYCSGKVVSTDQVPQNLWTMVFLPLAFGALGDLTEEQLEQIGLLFCRLDKDRTFGRAVNGFPMFDGLRIMLKSDLDRVRPIIEAELERRKNIPIPK